MKYNITYLTVKPSRGHTDYNVGFWFNKESIPPKYLKTRTIEYDGKIFDEGWNKLVKEDIVTWEVV